MTSPAELAALRHLGQAGTAAALLMQRLDAVDAELAALRRSAGRSEIPPEVLREILMKSAGQSITMLSYDGEYTLAVLPAGGRIRLAIERAACPVWQADLVAWPRGS